MSSSYHKTYYQAHRAEMIARQQIYYRANREKYLRYMEDYNKEYYKQHIQHCRTFCKKGIEVRDISRPCKALELRREMSKAKEEPKKEDPKKELKDLPKTPLKVPRKYKKKDVQQLVITRGEFTLCFD